jgi:hypothetical protein
MEDDILFENRKMCLEMQNYNILVILKEGLQNLTIQNDGSMTIEGMGVS